MKFVGLHIHSDYSLLDGASQLPDLVNRVVELDMPAVALTDHGVMYGAIELLKVCKAKGVKPIIGNEMYVINGDIEKQERRPRYHQVVLAQNTQGYKNLVKLTSISHLKGVQGKGIFSRPCINKDLLEQYCEGLIVTSACLGGEVPQAILQNRPEIARRVALWYKERFGDNYYLELQDHGSPEDRIVNVELVQIARELNIDIICTNDSHYISCYDVEAHDALLCIQTGKKISEDKRLRYSGTEYLKSAAEMALLFRDHLPQEVVMEAIANTVKLADKVEPYQILGEPRLPNYPVPEGFTADTYLEKVAWEGLLDRRRCSSREQVEPVYADRMIYELGIMQQMGFATYFLVVWDYIRYARDHQIPVGPGRGSAAGSLVAFALGITNIDPVHHGLLFERFLNPERKSMPDIDTDFCIERRGEVIQYVTEKYGPDRVAQIITYNRMTSRAVLKDVARVLDIPHKEADQMTKMIPVLRGKPAKLKEMISSETPSPEFKVKYDRDEIVPGTSDVTYRRWIDMGMRIEGTNKSTGIHAAGVVIASEPLDEVIPLELAKEGGIVTQYSMEDIESMGLLKMDFLGLRNLTMIEKTLNLIAETTGERLDLSAIPLDDPEAYQLLGRGDLEGIFQLESSGMCQIARELRPSNLEDISSILALYRPGPLDAGLIPKFIRRKHGREPIEYPHALLEPILNETYGVLCYQEQIMKMAQDMAGYSLGQADLLRRAMGKKKPEEMQKHRQIFIDGSIKNGVSSKIAEELFEQMLQFAEYCFNKSHSTAYGYVTYQTAYLKAKYPVEYMAALLSSCAGDQAKTQRYISICKGMDIIVDLPDINLSGKDFTVHDRHIRFGLSAIRNVGEAAVDALLEARQSGPFQSLADLCDRVDLNRRTAETLIKCGALDSMNPQKNRRQLLEDLNVVLDWAQSRARSRQKDAEIGQGSLFDMLGESTGVTLALVDVAPQAARVDADFSTREKLQFEKELLGFYVSEHPLEAVRRSARILGPIQLSDLEHQSDTNLLLAIVMITEIKTVITKKGDPMAILKIEDQTGSAEAVVFPKSYAQVGEYIKADAHLVVWGKLDRQDENRCQFIIEDVEPVESVKLLMVSLSPDDARDVHKQVALQSTLKQVSARDQAKLPVFARVARNDRSEIVQFPRQFWVKDGETALFNLNQSGFQASLVSLSGY